MPNTIRTQGGRRMKDAIVIKPALADQVKNAMIHGRVIFFSAPCGFGKTTTAWALLEGKKVHFAAAGEPGFRLPLLRETWDVLLLDQLQNLPEEEQEAFRALVQPLYTQYCGEYLDIVAQIEAQ